MKVIKADIFILKIPFKFTFGHSLQQRLYSDSIVVKLIADTGICGYGEGLPRIYVTGETADESLHHIKTVLLPAVIGQELPEIDADQPSYLKLSSINTLLPFKENSGLIAWNAAKCAVEIALIDCILRNHNKSLSCLFPPKKNEICYSAVLTSGDIENTIAFANKFKDFDMKHIKIKVGTFKDIERIASVRDIMGTDVSIRLDANGAFSKKEAVTFINSVEGYGIESIEQPVPRGDVSDLAEVKAGSSIPVMADESVVTMDDAVELIQHNACDILNLRISKCGGIYNTLHIADFALQKGMGIQLGCQVGETAILSAAGRHIAAYLADLKFIEGSYSTFLLAEDISKEIISFGHGGRARLLKGPGLGITVVDELLSKYSHEVVSI